VEGQVEADVDQDEHQAPKYFHKLFDLRARERL
jgi:hypothetical protein